MNSHYDSLIFIMNLLIPGKTVFILRRGRDVLATQGSNDRGIVPVGADE